MKFSETRHGGAPAHETTRPNNSAAVSASPAMAAQAKLIESIHDSPYMAAQRVKLQSLFGGEAQLEADPVQREAETEPLPGKFAPQAMQLQNQSRPNNTGLPDNLKAGIETLSGVSMDNVNVHYNSPQPAQLNALAYAQGSDIHVAPGQEKNLPHEAWHVVQQAQGRVKPTMQMKQGVPVNDDTSLEREADVMGEKAIRAGHDVLQGGYERERLGARESAAAKLPQLANQDQGGQVRQGAGASTPAATNIARPATHAVAQRAIIYEAGPHESRAWQVAFFARRCSEGKATTGEHNYAINCNTGEIKRSSTSAHAEILLIASSKAEPGNEILLVSEYKPCKYCQQAIDHIESERGVHVRILYLLPYEEKGDGDKTATREYYKKLGFLEGGGEYTYTVRDGWDV